MLTLKEVKQIVNKLLEQNSSISERDFSDDVSYIVYYNDIFECDNITINNRHIDIEFCFGEYYEVGEDTSLFSFICKFCNLPILQEKQKIIIYQK